jgi:hypothetical protein
MVENCVTEVPDVEWLKIVKVLLGDAGVKEFGTVEQLTGSRSLISDAPSEEGRNGQEKKFSIQSRRGAVFVCELCFRKFKRILSSKANFFLVVEVLVLHTKQGFAGAILGDSKRFQSRQTSVL